MIVVSRQGESKMEIAKNKKANFNYEIVSRIEAGIQLTGPEVKALRAGKLNISEAYVSVEHGEAWLVNASVEPVAGAHMSGLESASPRRSRKLLLRKKEILTLAKELDQQGMTAVPMSAHFNAGGFAKIIVGVGKGKKLHDKRATIKKREWDKQKRRTLKEYS
nr:SsrA-binding protein SmpB [Thalassospira xiamenensis]